MFVIQYLIANRRLMACDCPIQKYDNMFVLSDMF